MRKTLSIEAIYDVIIIGGGPAGMTAAIAAASCGRTVLLLEKNPLLGVKLRRTGGGRCNITNNTPVVRDLLSAYKDAGKFLFSPFSKFDVVATRQWLDSIGIPTVDEVERRVFPQSQSAVQVTEALIAEMKRVGVVVHTGESVSGLEVTGEGRWRVTTNQDTYKAASVIVATGGSSHPDTGSTGDALPWLAKLGHTLEQPQNILVPVAVVENDVTSRLGGVSLPDAGITIIQGAHIVSKARGKVLFTHFGLSGPGILNQSSVVATALQTKEPVTITLDVLPHYDAYALEQMLLDRLMTARNKMVRNQFTDLIPTSLVVPLLTQAGVDLATLSHDLRVEQRKAVIKACKGFSFTVVKLLGAEKAIVSSGGVSLPEVDFKTMESRLQAGLYLVGDVLNIDRPSGGYSLQLCWTTGMVAGLAAASRG